MRHKSVLVTGGAQGLGEGICRRLADDGYQVTAADVQVEAGQKLAADIQGQFIKCDVRVPDQVESAIQSVVAKHGTLDALVNNAGVIGGAGSQRYYGDLDIDVWKNVFDVNVNGTFYGLKYGLSQMVKQESGGVIVNISSIAGFRGILHLGAYIPTKFAVRGMTHAAAVEYGNRNIRVNAIAPTAVETPLVKGFMDNVPDREIAEKLVTASNAQPGVPQPSDIAGACSFLVSEDARYITGVTLPVDAGSLSRLANTLEDRHE